MNPRVSPIRRQRRRIVPSGWLARTAPTIAVRKGAAGWRMPSDALTTFIVPPPRIASGGIGASPKASPSAATVR